MTNPSKRCKHCGLRGDEPGYLLQFNTGQYERISRCKVCHKVIGVARRLPKAPNRNGGVAALVVAIVGGLLLWWAIFALLGVK